MIALTKQEKKETNAAYERTLGAFRQPLPVKLGQADTPISAKAPPERWYKIPPIWIFGGFGLMVLITILTRKED